MKKYMDILKRSILFKGMDEAEITSMLGCLSAYTKSYSKGSTILRTGETTADMGLVLSGNVNLIKEDYWGNRSIMVKIEEGQIFGEVYACLGHEPLNLIVSAAADTTVLFLNIRKVTGTCTAACEFHTRLIQNLLKELADKAFILTRKIEHTSKRTTRGKLLSYLSEQALKAGGSTFEIPFNRQELADYLFVERSAMSGELSRMRAEGILTYQKNQFRLLNPPEY